MADSFTGALLAWFERHGRRGLPWQHEPTPYRVWVSEVMLQQTQVSTVIPYFERFMERFPTLDRLAQAPTDEVLALWSGLGYYSRARNLQKAARLALERHDGELPETVEALSALPGIGRSTAGAILALSRNLREPILDGNVRRVLARYHAVDRFPGLPEVERELWRLADGHTPEGRAGAYTQAIMDLGATLCTRARPACDRCPVAAGCAALAQGRVAELPVPRPRRAQPERAAVLLLVTDPAGRVLLERRPPAGIWGGLWSLPECPPDEAPMSWCRRRLGAEAGSPEPLAPFRHTFTHFRLEICPVRLRLAAPPGRIMEGGTEVWYKPEHLNQLGLPTPIRRLLGRLPDL